MAWCEPDHSFLTHSGFVPVDKTEVEAQLEQAEAVRRARGAPDPDASNQQKLAEERPEWVNPDAPGKDDAA
jgi:hypothetical protein